MQRLTLSYIKIVIHNDVVKQRSKSHFILSFSQALDNLNVSMNQLTQALNQRSEALNAQGASAADARVIADLSELSQAASGIEAVLTTDGTGAA